MARKFGDQNALEELTGIPARSWEAKRLRGNGPPFYRIGRRCLYDLEAAEAWIRAQRRTSTSDPGDATHAS